MKGLLVGERSSQHSRRLGALAIAVLVGLFGLGTLLLGGAASAAAPQTITTGSSCVTSAKAGCVQGKVIDENLNGAGGIKVAITGPAGSADATTGDDGYFYFKVDKPGSYTVTLDKASLPSGMSATATKLTVTASMDNITSAGFRLNGVFSGSVSHKVKPVSEARLVWEQFSQGLLFGLLLALAAIGLSLIYGTTGLSNFAHSEQITLGGFLAYVFAVQLGLNMILAIVIVVLLTGASGYVQDRLMWAPLRRKGIGLNQLMVVTIGLSISLEYIYNYIWGGTVHPVTNSQKVELNTGPLDITPTAYWSMLVSIIVLVAVGMALLYTRIGRATRAVADNPALAAASGIDVDRVIRIVWTVSTALAGLSGVLYGLVNGGINWLTGAQLLLLVFAAVILGGIGTAFGALVGSLVIGVAADMSTLWLPQDLKYGVALAVLIIVLLVRPQGILGRKERVG